MRNLKKVGAVALAAVMAVTFAPVASLDVFASTGVNSANEITSATSTIDATGDYKVTANAVASITVENDATNDPSNTKESNITIDLNGKAATVILKDHKANVTIKNSTIPSGAYYKSNIALTLVLQDASGAPKTAATAQGVSYKTLTLNGDYTLNDAMSYVKNSDGDLAVGSTPVVYTGTTNTNTVVGQAAIDVATANAQASGYAGNDITVLNGSVAVNGLISGNTAKVGSVTDNAQAGATISNCTAQTDKTLQKVATVYSYKFTARNNTTGTTANGEATYTDTQYKAGPVALTVTPVTDTNLATSTIATKKIEADNNCTLAVKSDDYAADQAITYTFGKDWKTDGTTLVNATNHGTYWVNYYTFDPTNYVNAGQIILKVDGSKYSVNDTTLASKASSSVEVIKGTTWASDSNKNVQGTFTTKGGVSVSAPKDLTLVQKAITTVSGTNATTTVTNYIAGKDKDIATSTAIVAGTEIVNTGNISKVALNVAQVADGRTKNIAITDVPDKSKAEVTHGSALGYYKVVDATDAAASRSDYYFGPVSVVKAEFDALASGKKTTDLLFQPTWTNESVFASKEIKTVVSGVKTGVSIKGETSEKITATAADGTKTWAVNMDGSATVDATRFFNTKSGSRLLTIDPVEIATLQSAEKKAEGWVKESETIKVKSKNAEGTKLYRLFNTIYGEHIYTTDKGEYDRLNATTEWRGEGVAFTVADKSTGVPVYGVYKISEQTQKHWYTTSAAELASMKSQGWVADGNDGAWGVRFYAFK